nr:hypothetical protein [Tanacetum cinerariifolium]
MSVLSDDQMNFVINYLTAKSMWDDLILYHEGPSDVKESRVKDLKLYYNIFKFKKDEEEVSSTDNEMVEVRVLMALAEDNNAINKEGARNSEWVKIFMRKFADLVFAKSLADDIKVFIPCVQRPWLFEAEGFILPNHDTGRILPAESQRNTTDPPFAVTDSSSTDYYSADESSVCSTPLPPLKKLYGAEPISGPKNIKSILRLKSTFKAETLKGFIIKKPSSAHAKGYKSSSASKFNSGPTGN